MVFKRLYWYISLGKPPCVCIMELCYLTSLMRHLNKVTNNYSKTLLLRPLDNGWSHINQIMISIESKLLILFYLRWKKDKKKCGIIILITYKWYKCFVKINAKLHSYKHLKLQCSVLLYLFKKTNNFESFKYMDSMEGLNTCNHAKLLLRYVQQKAVIL